MASEFSIKIPIELQDRLTHEFDRVSTAIRGKEEQLRQVMGSIKDRSTESLKKVADAMADLDKQKISLRSLENFKRRLEEISPTAKKAANGTKEFYDSLLKERMRRTRLPPRRASSISRCKGLIPAPQNFPMSFAALWPRAS